MSLRLSPKVPHRARIEQRGRQPPLQCQATMTNRVDVRMNAVQTPVLQPPRDSTRRQPDLFELHSADDAPLALGQLPNFSFRNPRPRGGRGLQNLGHGGDGARQCVTWEGLFGRND